jgi:glycosyltransferase involved in cell wall biosynthesis
VRILMVTDLYWPLIGGLEIVVRELSRELAGRGHAVAVATLRHDGMPEHEDDGGVGVHRIGGSLQRREQLFAERGRRYAPPFPDPEATVHLREVVAGFRPDVVHGHNWLIRSFLPLKRRRGPRLVVSLHDYGETCAKRTLHDLRQEICSGPRVRKCLPCSADHYGTAKGWTVAGTNWVSALAESRLVDRYLAISSAVAAGNRLAERGLPHEVIPNFSAVPPPDAAGHAALLDLLPDEPFLLFVGALGRHKGVDVLLEAYGRIADAPPLVLIGARWPGMPAVPDGVTVLHDWPPGAVAGAWQRCMIGLVPSAWAEPFGLVAVEAMQAGRPVIASAAGGLADIVVDGETGLLTPPGDPTALAAALRRLLADEGLRRTMGEAGRTRATAFAPAAIVPRFERAYARVLAA